MINFTPNAIRAIDRFVRGNDGPIAGLRIAIVGGGCAGFQYSMRLEAQRAEDDIVLEVGGLTLLVDPLSAPLLHGVTVDYVEGLSGSGFKFDNPNATSSCACGSSFSA